MKTLNAIHHSTPARKKQILEVALQHFARRGIEATAVEELGRDAGISVSSIYHHFGGKEQLAAAVYFEGILRFQEGYVQALEAKADAQDGITSIVFYHLDWVAANPDWARYLFDTRRKIFAAPQEQELEALNQAFYARLARWFQPHIKNGKLRMLPFDTFSAMLVGPCQELARTYLRGGLAEDMDKIKQATAEAIWRALGRAR